MPAVNFSPVFNGWQGFTPSGLPMSGGFLYTYQAGTSTPLATYTTNAGSVTNANPIVLGTDGRPPQEIWLLTTNAYKFVLTDSLLNVIGTYDNISGIDNSVPAALSEWVVSGLTPSYVSATQFTLAGDKTALFEVGRRVRYTLGSGQNTGSITASVFGALTTVTVVTDSIPLDNTLSAVDYGFLDALKPSVPTVFKSAVTAPSVTTTAGITAGTTILSAAQPGFSAYTSAGNTVGTGGTLTDVIYDTKNFDAGNNYNNATGVFTAPVTGRYAVSFSLCPNFQAAEAAGVYMQTLLKKNGSNLAGTITFNSKSAAAGTGQIGPLVQFATVLPLTAADTLKVQATYSGTSNSYSSFGCCFSAVLLG